MLNILTSIWSAQHPNAGRNMHFNVCCAKRLKKVKSKKFQQNSAKKTFFLICTKILVKCFIPRKIKFSLLKTFFWGNKTVDQHFGANLKTFGKILQPFLLLSISSFLAWKFFKLNIYTRIWSVQHPIAGWNIQQLKARSWDVFVTHFG